MCGVLSKNFLVLMGPCLDGNYMFMRMKLWSNHTAVHFMTLFYGCIIPMD